MELDEVMLGAAGPISCRDFVNFEPASFPLALAHETTNQRS